MSHPRLFPRLVAFLSFLAFSPMLVRGQQPPVQQTGPSGGSFDITGYVRSDADDQPVQGARLQLKTESDNIAHPSILSSITGEFRFAGFPAGDYFILVDKSGYEAARVR